MKTLAWSAAAAVVVLILGVLVVRHVREHERESAAARANFARLDQIRASLVKTMRSMAADHAKIDRATVIADNASNKRHDSSFTLSEQQAYDLAHTERKQVDEIRGWESDLESRDETEAEVFEGLYGAQSVYGLRRDMAALNQARQNASLMWWRAAQSIEDDVKAAINGYPPPEVSGDEIIREYDESARDYNTAAGLQRIVDGEVNALFERLLSDAQKAKAKV